jgi:hypothetical protein
MHFFGHLQPSQPLAWLSQVMLCGVTGSWLVTESRQMPWCDSVCHVSSTLQSIFSMPLSHCLDGGYLSSFPQWRCCFGGSLSDGALGASNVVAQIGFFNSYGYLAYLHSLCKWKCGWVCCVLVWWWERQSIGEVIHLPHCWIWLKLWGHFQKMTHLEATLRNCHSGRRWGSFADFKFLLFL